MKKLLNNPVARYLKEHNIIIILIVVFIAASMIGSPKFLKASNQFNILQSIGTYGTIAVGLTFIFLIGHIDLSIGYQVAIDAAVMLLATNALGLIPGIIITLIVGIFLGYLNGTIVTRLEIPPLIATLAVMTVLKGLVLVVTRGGSLASNVKGLTQIYNYRIFGFLYPSVLVLILLVAAAAIFLVKTRTGVNLYIIGGNREAGALSGINTPRLTRLAFTVGGFTAALCGILSVMRLGAATYNLGDNIDITAICSVVIGGVSMLGGKGNMTMCVLGVAVLQIINNLMTKLGLHSSVQALVTGIVVIFVLIADRYTRSKEKAKSAA